MSQFKATLQLQQGLRRGASPVILQPLSFKTSQKKREFFSPGLLKCVWMLAPHFSVSGEITGCRGITFYQCKLKTQRDYYSNTIFLIDLGFFHLLSLCLTCFTPTGSINSQPETQVSPSPKPKGAFTCNFLPTGPLLTLHLANVMWNDFAILNANVTGPWSLFVRFVCVEATKRHYYTTGLTINRTIIGTAV